VGGRCLRARFRYASRDDAIGRGLTTMIRLMLQRSVEVMAPEKGLSKQIPRFQLVDSWFEGEDVRLLEPVTGLPYAQTTRQVVGGRFSVEGEPAPSEVTWTWVHTYEFIYEQPR
jgi:hypothetical protein